MTEEAGYDYDISIENYREYVFADGKTYHIDNPSRLFIVDGSHRVVDDDGITHRPERGYVAIRWVQRDGKPYSF